MTTRAELIAAAEALEWAIERCQIEHDGYIVPRGGWQMSEPTDSEYSGYQRACNDLRDNFRRHAAELLAQAAALPAQEHGAFLTQADVDKARGLLFEVSGSEFVSGNTTPKKDKHLIYERVVKALSILSMPVPTRPPALPAQSLRDMTEDDFDAALDALSAQEPVAWIRFASDGGYDGPIADVDRRMDEIRKNSGAWTPLYTTPPDQTARIAALESEIQQWRDVTARAWPRRSSGRSCT